MREMKFNDGEKIGIEIYSNGFLIAKYQAMFKAIRSVRGKPDQIIFEEAPIIDKYRKILTPI